MQQTEHRIVDAARKYETIKSASTKHLRGSQEQHCWIWCS